jgi:Fic family protein
MWQLPTYDQAKLNSFIQRIEEKKAALDKIRPLPSSVLARIEENIAVEWTYNSNAIEGNTITHNETKLVLELGITVGGKSLREHLEIHNHQKAIQYLNALANAKENLRAIDILKLHEIVMRSIDDDFAGRIRTAGVRITGANFIPPAAHKASALLDELVATTEHAVLINQPILFAAWFHHQFVWIHPFFDGNGRTVRLLMNLLLMRAGYPPAIILKNDRKKYYDALNAANNGKYNKLYLLVLQAVERSLTIYLQGSPGYNLEEEYQEISNLVEEAQMPYSAEYVSLLARQGKIDAYKEGRNWLTTKKAVENYMQQRRRVRSKGKGVSYKEGRNKL